jgi:hypothetical protein
MADAVLEGKQMSKARGAEGEEISEEDLMYLGEATLQKIRSGALDFDATQEEDEDEYTVEYEEEVDIDYEEEEEELEEEDE